MSVSLLITSDDQHTITTLHDALEDTDDVMGLPHGKVAVEELLYRFAKNDKLREISEMPLVKTPMPLTVARTEGGALSVEYTSIRGDDGSVLWGDMSAHTPAATFYLQVGQSQSGTPATSEADTLVFVVAGGTSTPMR